jgi:hypothetical protein
MIGKSNAWSASGQQCSICGNEGEMQIDVEDEEGYTINSVFCVDCLRQIVRGEFNELEEK